MAEVNPPTWMQAGSYPARNDRLGAISSMLCYPGFAADESAPLRIRQGVKPSYQNYQLKVRPAATPNMTVIVSAGYCWVDNHDVGGFGAYTCVNDADKILTIAPAGGAGQYRRDAIVASVYDAETSGSVSEWRLEVIQGVYAASAGAAVLPTLPSSAVLLGSVLVSPGQTSVTAANISDHRNYTVAAGGILPVPASIMPNRLHPGQVVYLSDADLFAYGRSDGSYAPLILGVGAGGFARKTSDTSRANTEAMTPDPHLSVPVAVYSTYTVDAYLVYTAGTTGDINIALNGPSGVEGSWSAVGFGRGVPPASGVEGYTVRLNPNTIASTQPRSYGGDGGEETLHLRGIVRTAGTSGTCSVVWSQAASNSTATVMRAESWLRVQRVA
ncbi:hypothetical protein [Streptomyces paromomycinus]|uniref:Uncharacterized protein n=1 Tax=Streptomyces paromomycinus TaxID=92743 RepID=A0A401W9Z4_STREY|nr:hypothetical protein [Streptomyces paromomycinus]GCD46109.1 hypothetical protein GKJPGBOP_05856 [Streptomyces paromomycinus]